jgi:hypothetical protein
MVEYKTSDEDICMSSRCNLLSNEKNKIKYSDKLYFNLFSLDLKNSMFSCILIMLHNSSLIIFK